MREAHKRRLAEFVWWVENHITGDEKGEAQSEKEAELFSCPRTQLIEKK
ncbi:MAG: hypothetical protein K8R46_05430 [Pirellulales bacterium]|nr:hypothetical protein [Pirellulales bacterium]